MTGYIAILRKGKTAFPKQGYFDSLEDAVDFAKRRQDDVLAWMFATCPMQDPKRHHALDPALKAAVRQLWTLDRTAPPPAVAPMEPSNEAKVPRAPKTPQGVAEVPRPTVPSVPVEPEPEPEPEPSPSTPAILPPAPDPEPEPETNPQTPVPRRKRRRRKDAS